MKSQRLVKHLVLLLLMVAAASLAWAMRPTLHMADVRQKPDLELLFPKRFGEWELAPYVSAQMVSPDQQAELNRIYNQTLSRTYRNAQGGQIMLSVAYGGDQSDGTAAHRPEVCYPAQGFQVLSSRNNNVQLSPARTVPVRQLVAKLGVRVEPITYWVVVGDRVALSGTQQKLAQISYGINGVIPDGMLLRVSSIDNDATRAYAVQQNFIQQLSLVLEGVNHERVFGAVAASSTAQR